MQLPTLNYNLLDDDTLAELFKARVQMIDEKKTNYLASLLEQAALIEAKKGKGKTLLCVGVSWELRERFDIPVIAIGTDMGIYPDKFGPYQFMPASDFRDEMERIAVAAEEEENAEQVKKMFSKYGISIIGACLVFDESRKLLNSRKPMDKLVQLTADFMSYQRHYKVTTLLTAPDRDELDKRVVRQIDWFGQAYYNKYTRTAHTRFKQGLDVIPISVDGGSDAEHLPFQEMYNSWNMIGSRRSSLQNVKI